MHYHIRWSDSTLDWKPFRTHEEAEEAATRLARPGETFTVERVSDKTCVRCLELCERVLAKKKTRDAEMSSQSGNSSRSGEELPKPGTADSSG